MTGTAQTARGGTPRSSGRSRPAVRNSVEGGCITFRMQRGLREELLCSLLLGAALVLLPAAAPEAAAQPQVGDAAGGAAVEWPFVGSDAGNTRYSAADTLTPDNVDGLEVAWTWRPADRPRQEFGTVPGSFTSTPIMVDGTVTSAPTTLGTPGAPGAIVTKGGLVFAGGGEDALYAFDKRAGREVWSAPLSERSTATPMTYRTGTGRQFVLIATGSGASQELVAFATPE